MALYVDIEKTCGDFNLQIAFSTENEVFAILGASGCGKSMTLKCIAGIEKPDRGIIRLDDKVLFDSDSQINLPARKRNIGYLFQDYALFPNMTVFENIMCGARDRRLAREFVDRFYLEGKEGLYPGQLSGGQKQRVALARMLAAGPEYLLLDEPFSALDNYLKSRLERELMDVLEDYGRRALFVSHDRNEVYRLTDRIAVMEDGHVVDIRPKRELFESPHTLAATLLTGCKNVSVLEYREDGLYAVDWDVYLPCPQAGAGECVPVYRYAAVRAHYFQPAGEQAGNPGEGMEAGPGEETAGLTGTEAGKRPTGNPLLECEIVREIEDTFSMVVLFRNKNGVRTGGTSVLTAEFPKEEWVRLRERTILAGKPLYLCIPADKIILMEK